MKLNIKLAAYSKGIFPDTRSLVPEAPKDGDLYVRKDGEWVAEVPTISTPEESGIKINRLGPDYIILKKEEFVTELPEELREDTLYYVRDSVGISQGIFRIIDGKVLRVDGDLITHHNQLLERDAEDCHPIEAIIGLRAELNSHQDQIDEDVENLNKLTQTVSDLTDFANENRDSIESLEQKTDDTDDTVAQLRTDLEEDISKAQSISISESDQIVTFTDYEGNETSFRAGNLTDDITIVQNSDKQLEAIAIKDANNLVTPSNIVDKFILLDNKDTEHDSEIQSLKDYNVVQDSNLSTLSAKVETQAGLGGYLAANNFNTATPTQEQLTEYALQLIEITEPTEIFNGTRIKNLYDNNVWILTNTQNTDPVVFEWSNNGPDIVATATNDILGIVKGSVEQYKANVDVNGELAINGLEEKLDEIDSSIETTAEEFNTAIQEVTDNIEDINGSITDLQTNKANDNEVVKLEGDQTITGNIAIIGSLSLNGESLEDLGAKFIWRTW